MPTIKVSDEEYNMIVEARKKLAMEGINKLPLEIKNKQLTDLEKFTLGAIVGIGAWLLLKELNRK
ncbi:hypothetical protein J4479_01435 [Candidatus Woesearchaeota archaeon]|nr:hypothetical protein [Candidatus Woesearchaeota archaeon]